MPSQDEISRILRLEVFRAKRAYEQAHEQFMAITNDIPSELPHPDGVDRIVNAGKTYRSTMEIYSRSVREFNNFISTGVIPDGLKDEEKN